MSSNPVNDVVYSMQHHVIQFVSDLWQVDGFLRLLRFSPPVKIDRLDIAEILLKVVLNNIHIPKSSKLWLRILYSNGSHLVICKYQHLTIVWKALTWPHNINLWVYIYPHNFLLKCLCQPWRWAVMYMCVRCIHFPPFLRFSDWMLELFCFFGVLFFSFFILLLLII